MLKIYNTLTRKKEEFIPLNKGRVSIYLCGPTVYDLPHIGHARSAFVFELLRRYFAYSGYKVHFVRNVTDVDDKIIKRAKDDLISEGARPDGDVLKKKVADVSSRYLEEYHKAMDMLGVAKPDDEPRATLNIPQMIKFIEELVGKGSAYVADGSVYFDVDSYNGYGELSGQDKKEMLSNVRIEPDKNKKAPLDFALWKKVKESEPYWQSPWGNGRPGWHIECSVMSTGIFGTEFDIHGGGLDLIFPHHENEIAQARAHSGGKFARVWVHNGFLTVRGEKMSKSLKNYITIGDFLEKHGDIELLKMLFLSSHYKSPVDYTDEKINEMARSKERLLVFLDKAQRLGAGRSAPVAVKGGQGAPDEFVRKFEEAMDDDLNTPVALSVFFEAAHSGNKFLDDCNLEEAARISGFISGYSGVLGMDLSYTGAKGEGSELIAKLIEDRARARKNREFKKADDIRAELAGMGVAIEDTPKGTVWRRK
ncbi:MAG: cysteine--tRNA ligase [Candidatus Omnitrophica bacterium]|nr:cysteine--tRNA ligase [Candidatus Omnitrophota bacterium]